jgi:hypothetical protein
MIDGRQPAHTRADAWLAICKCCPLSMSRTLPAQPAEGLSDALIEVMHARIGHEAVWAQTTGERASIGQHPRQVFRLAPSRWRSCASSSASSGSMFFVSTLAHGLNSERDVTASSRSARLTRSRATGARSVCADVLRLCDRSAPIDGSCGMYLCHSPRSRR